MSEPHITLPSNPQDRKKIQDMVVEMSKALSEMDDRRSYLNDTVKRAKEEFDIEPKLMRRLAKAHHKRNFPDVKSEHEEFEYLYEALLEGRKDA